MDFQENQENTKELQNLEELKEQAIDTLELDIVNDMDENMETSTKAFEELITKENTIEEKENKEPKKLKEKLQNLKKKWDALSKKQKIIIITTTCVIFLTLLGILIFLLKNKEEEKIKEPDVIVDLDNYRYQNGKLIFLDKEKKELGEYTCENQDQDLCYVAYYENDDNFDEPKKIQEDEEILMRTPILLDKYVFIYDNKEKEDGLITLYDMKEQKTIETYEAVKGYEKLKNSAILKNKSGEYGLMHFTEENIETQINFSYTYLGIIEDKEQIDKVVGKRNNQWYISNMADETLTKAISGEIKNYNDKYIKIIDESGNYHIVDYDNKALKEESYEYIDLLDNYVLYIKNQKIYVEDYEKHQMNIEGIELLNDNYVEKNIYIDNMLSKTEKSYEISFQGSSMIIEIFDKENKTERKSINLNEGRLSATLNFLNYFEGKLYIYKDQEKENLLGTYTCENKNNISDNTNELSNCLLARESFYQDNDIEENKENSLGLLPIYNDRYIFINDASFIVLYDMKENTQKSKYKSVDAGVYSNETKPYFASASNTQIIAENTSGKYGIIKMNQNSVEGYVGFNYNHIERIGLNYIVQDSSGYALMDGNGTLLSDTATNKIRNFNKNYLTRYDGSKYYIYPYKGEKIIDKGYDYISLDEEYFGAVEDQKLNFYSYKEPKTPLLEESISLKITKYYGEGTLAYIATFKKDQVEVRIGKEDGNYEGKTYSLIKSKPVDEENNTGKDEKNDQPNT